ncbi:hypothetical protein CC1G_04345 [Coprinopsis cinerea okayama7|uniref:Methyltransferase domain-containing protein n=1 Tax=Coprinopsis cinerea (strain Okayama-7 / 130 / ATCC MYA-4618 / FGSC 9003) TaxID=240176 RepID=A8N0P2_COPC7|nr:hypothetical protein CC1G_04345 [Coprinopsis cinerea okayama7\|eukprot:XP_001828374.1 hypothetical protein CC1G_04345 [Coprinopsis cinerea okayama7\
MSSAGHHHHHHAHGHAHGHAPQNHGHQDRAEANRAHFNEHTHLFNEWPHAKERRERTIEALLKYNTLDKENTTVLEFACGTGLISAGILPHVKSVLGVDISDEAVKLFNERSEKEGVLDRCRGIAVNIETDKGALQGQKFDMIFCSSSYHHFENPSAITKLLAGYLKPTGTLVVIDHLATGDAIPDSHKHIVAVQGFSEEDMKRIFGEGGLEMTLYEVIRSSEEGDRELFVAKGVLKE